MRVDPLRAIIREIQTTNIIRLILMHATILLVVNLNGPHRTPLQVYRRCKKKRIHNEWRINRKLRKRLKITIIGAFRNYCKRARKKFKDDIIRETLPALAHMAETMKEVKNGAK